MVLLGIDVGGGLDVGWVGEGEVEAGGLDGADAVGEAGKAMASGEAGLSCGGRSEAKSCEEAACAEALGSDEAGASALGSLSGGGAT